MGIIKFVPPKIKTSMIGDQEANGSLQIKSGKPNTTKYMNRVQKNMKHELSRHWTPGNISH